MYGEGEKPARDRAYSAAMEKIYRDYPDDVEAALFYALSLMGTVRAEDPAGVQIRLRAGAIAADVYQRMPIIPAQRTTLSTRMTTPNTLVKALDAARRYAEIAPDAPHALHMPSHIFLQLGMWQEAATSMAGVVGVGKVGEAKEFAHQSAGLPRPALAALRLSVTGPLRSRRKNGSP